MRRLSPVLAFTILLATSVSFLRPTPAPAQQTQTAAQVTPDPAARLLIDDYNRKTSDTGLSEPERIALASELDTQLQALLTAAAADPKKTREIIAAMKAARIGLPLTDEVRSVLETAGKLAAGIRDKQDETAIADIVEGNAGNPDAIADAVADYITGSDDPVRTTGVASRMAAKPQYESVKPALGTGIGQAIATLGITQPELAGQMLAAAQEVDDPALQDAIAEGEQDITGDLTTGPSEGEGSEQDSTPESPASPS
ncbi:hypothetical protein [Parvibaculum sp. MBR-TMA-1.3b-4.2]|jgi:hypothetical protein